MQCRLLELLRLVRESLLQPRITRALLQLLSKIVNLGSQRYLVGARLLPRLSNHRFGSRTQAMQLHHLTT